MESMGSPEGRIQRENLRPPLCPSNSFASPLPPDDGALTELTTELSSRDLVHT
jgi:hypothetical protein